jgi:hypothetical protein
MRKSLRLSILSLILSTTIGVAAQSDDIHHDDFPIPHYHTQGQIQAIGPEYYHVQRKRKGGTSQCGDAWGARYNYDRIKRYKLYWGLQAFYGTGQLDGKSGSGDKTRSQLTDKQIEGYVGYTFACKNPPYFALIPFAGGGYFQETNNFRHPTPIHLRFKTYFPYATFGFLSSLRINPCWSVGFNLRIRTPWNTKCKVTNDPQFDEITLLVGDRFHYRLELPIVYFGPLWYNLRLGIMPFYEYRAYGGRENYPFDFFKTTFKIYGINLQLIYEF